MMAPHNAQALDKLAQEIMQASGDALEHASALFWAKGCIDETTFNARWGSLRWYLKKLERCCVEAERIFANEDAAQEYPDARTDADWKRHAE